MLIPQKIEALKATRPKSIDAYEYVLKGVYITNSKYLLSHKEKDFKSAVKIFNKAAEVDPEYLPLIIKNCKKAYELDQNLSDSNAGMAWIYYLGRDYAQSYHYFKRALEIDPNRGMRNSYSPDEGKPEGVETGRLLLPPKKANGDNVTVTEQCLYIAAGNKGGRIIISNNVFLNSAKFAIQGGIPGGTIIIKNNIFVSNRMAAIEIWGTSASNIPEAEIAFNSVLFTWSRLKDFLDMGYGLRIMTKMKYNVHHNIFGTSTLTGVDHTQFNDDEKIELDNNLFFLNKQSDMQYSPESNTKLNLSAEEFEDLEFMSVSGNKNTIPKGLPVHKAYLDGFLSARYTEEEDYDPDSPANQIREMLGINKQGKLTISVTMFGNRYPWKKALELFGAIKGIGAQIPE